ncbi:hypothetical protein [Streptosporangium carneum]|uniref:Uncharacterized protein n=1 Tax=Streptosporangium carneum TaxID=47481 RepID=A0A9W6IAQ6_9ACTN|nr:hypothetical protein GCM10017600_75160 [Streptosporangium carneum]
MNELVEAADEKVLAKTVARYGRVDRLAFTCDIIETGTDSCRLAQTRARAEQAS